MGEQPTGLGPSHPRGPDCEGYWIGGTADGRPCVCPMTAAVPDPTVEARQTCPDCGEVDRENRLGHRDGCRWLSNRARAARAAAPDALRVAVEALAAEWEQWSWHFRDVRKPVYKAHADKLRALLDDPALAGRATGGQG